MNDDPDRPSEAFPLTAWSFIHQMQDAQHPQRVAALNRFAGRYWKPVFCFLRVRGYPPHRAEDLTQEFFLRFLEHDWVRLADPGRGRFRNYLLRILVRFLSDQGPTRAPRQQTFEQGLVAVGGLLGDAERAWEPPAGETPETVFMRQWAVESVQHVRCRLKELCAKKDRTAWYEVFEAFHPTEPGGKVPSQEELASRLGMTRDQVRYAREQTEQWFRVLLRAEVREQVDSDDEVGAEVGELLALLSPR
jgi:RNA polymerase sigma-70 factor (ECF subfamily)